MSEGVYHNQWLYGATRNANTLYLPYGNRIHSLKNDIVMKQSILITALFAGLALTACNDDEGPAKLSKSDAQTEINEFSSSATQELQDLADAKGLAALADLSELTTTDDPFGGRVATDQKKLKAFFSKKGKQFRSIFASPNEAGRAKGEEPFNYNDKKGIYTWDPATETFVKSGTSTIIQVRFPSEGSATNNAELQLKAYSEVHTYDVEFDEHSYEPAIVKASLLVDNQEVASLDLEIDWDESGIPLSGTFSASVTPFFATVSFDISSSTKNTLSASLKKNNETLFATSIVVAYSSPAKQEYDLEQISGFVQVKNLTLKGTIDVQGADVSEEPDLNDFIKLQLYSGEKKIGDIVFETELVDGFEESVTYLKYNDGTKEKLETVFKPVLDEFETLEAEING
jgi:hypothetical protein